MVVFKAMTLKEYFYVYMLSSLHNKVLYVGVTSDLQKRIWEHKEKIIKGFTSKYNIDRLVYFEVYDDAESAITREKNIKNWKRDWKIKRIENMNPDWEDLYETLF